MAPNSPLLSALAGLLHDIGKVMVRAGVAGNRTWDELARRDFGYKHAMLSASFVDMYVPARWRGQVTGPVGNHHRPRSRADRIVRLADRLSAGERADSMAEEEPRKIHPRQLHSIFTRVRADGVEHPTPAAAYLPLAPLAVERGALFPGTPLPDGEVWRRYQGLWDALEEACLALYRAHDTANSHLESYLEGLLLALQRTTWCIPSAYYGSVPDISLYDHSRTTAALAAVLDRPGVDEARLDQWLANPEAVEEEMALLVGGDISGVQDFIYTITSQGATPGLRGRSFYLQLLTEAVARFVLRELGLPITNLIYAGGGNFYLLARPQDRERLPEIHQAISRALLQHHRGSLYVALAEVSLSGRDFFQGRISQAWGRLHEALQAIKHRRFAELPPDELAQLFQPQGHGGNEESVCQVCGQEHEAVRPDDPGDPDSVRKCPACLAFEELGDALRDARFLALDLVAPRGVKLDLEEPYGTGRDVLSALGMQAQVAARLSDVQGPPSDARRVLLALDDEGWDELSPGAYQAVGRRFLVNVTPTLKPDERVALRDDASFPDADKGNLPPAGRVKPFGVLAHQAQGIKRLGVLRMDVDNLGALFREGLGDRATLSRVAGLSFGVSLYFEGWVGALAQEVNTQHRHPEYPDGDRLYAIYSGGDDLFFVGAWDVVAELAIRIRADLDRYTGGHPGIHASGGLVLIGGKYPLYQAAEDAGDAEHAAKGFRWQDGGGTARTKDAFCFLGEPLPWSRFGLETDCPASLETVHGLMHFLRGLTQQNGAGGGPENGGKVAPKALLRRLVELYSQYVEAREAWRRSHGDVTQEGEPQVLWGPWTWRAVYTLARMAERTKRGELRELMDELRSTDYRMMERIGIAARWADLLGRRS